MTWPQRTPPHALLPHQVRAVNAAAAVIGRGGRGQLQHACGSGKTVTCQALAERLGARRVLVLLPSLALVGQTAQAWLRQYGDRMDFRVVCSDMGAASRAGEHVPEELRVGQPRTLTQPARIAEFIDPHAPDHGQTRVVFATYQSTAKIEAAQRLLTAYGSRPRFDLTVCDEAHRLAGRAHRAYNTVLHPDRIGSHRTVFATATPRVCGTDGNGLVVGMDNPGVFGPVLDRYSFRQAIADGRLVDYRVVMLGVDAGTVPGSVTRADPQALRAYAAALATAQTMRRLRLHRAVTFHTRVDHARSFADRLPAVFAQQGTHRGQPARPLTAEHLHGGMPMAERERLLNLLVAPPGGGQTVLSNAKVLAEGVDVPSLDAVVIADPRASVVDMVQIVGRALRTAPGKTSGTVIVPVLIEPGSTPRQAMHTAGFRQAAQVLAALRAHDDDLETTLHLAGENVENGLLPDLPDNVDLDLPASVREEFRTAVGVRLITATAGRRLGVPGRLTCACGNADCPDSLDTGL